MGISLFAWRDRAFLREQVDILEPHLVLTCGATSTSVFAKVIKDDIHEKHPGNGLWKWRGITVVSCKHPSIMPYQLPSALVELAQRLEAKG